MNPRTLLFAVVLGTLLWLGAGSRTLYAADEVVSDCSNDTELRAKVGAIQGSLGGTLTFDCGSEPATIVLSGTPLPPIKRATVIDGGGTVTISGGNASRIFWVQSPQAAPLAHLTLRGLTLTNGLVSGDGGAIYAEGPLTVEETDFRNNRSTGASGGAIVAYGPVTIRNSRFVDNSAVNGGALYPRHGSVVSISGTTFSGNSATGTPPANGIGGAILTWDGPQVTIDLSLFSDNHAKYRGNAVYITSNSAMTLTNTTVDEFDANSFIIFTNGQLRIDRSFVNADGGNVAAGVNGSMRLVNSTFSGGISIVTIDGATATGDFVTIVGRGTGVVWAGSGTSMRFKNSILQGSGGQSCFLGAGASIISDGFNISPDSSCNLTAPTDFPNTVPVLNGLGFRGGPTPVLLPAPGSPAIDAAQCVAGLAVDQRGVTRPQGPACDIGAAEVRRPLLSVLRTGSGVVASDVLGINCGSDCSAAFHEGTKVVLTASPDSGFRFDGWSGACSNSSGPCTLTIDNAMTVNALFSDLTAPPPPQFKVYLPTTRR